MTLEEFAKKCGVTIHTCEPEWGGHIAYKEKDYPNATICGFKTEAAAYKRWLEGKFGKTAGKMVIKLLKESK